MRQDYVVETISGLIQELTDLRRDIVRGKIDFLPYEKVSGSPSLPPREAFVLRMLKRGPVTAADMGEFGFSPVNFRQVVLNLRRKGYVISCSKGIYHYDLKGQGCA